MPAVDPLHLNTLLLVEDNPDDVLLLRRHMERGGIIAGDIDIADKGKKAVDQIIANHYDLIVFDYSLPDMNASDVIKLVRSTGYSNPLPALALTAWDDRNPAVELMKLGLYDFISKNELSPKVLRDSIEFVLERYRNDLIRERYLSENTGSVSAHENQKIFQSPSRTPDALASDASSTDDLKDELDVLVAGPLKIDGRQKQVFINDVPTRLSPKEYALLRLLAKEPGRVFSTDEIIAKLWPSNDRANSTDLKQYVHLLRKKIEPDPKQPSWLLTSKGFGYLLGIPEE
jgi:DNA-binding response OmpR family regulator